MSDSTYPKQNTTPGAQPAPQAQPPAGNPAQPVYRPSQMGATAPSPQAPYQKPAQNAAPAPQPTYPRQAPQTSYRQPAPQRNVPNFQQATASSQPAAPVTAAAHAAPKSSGGWVKTLVSGAVGALMATLITLAVSSAGVMAPAPDNGSTALPSATEQGAEGTSSQITAAGEDITLPEAVAAKTLPSVVCIYVYTEAQSYGWFGAEQQSGEQMSGLGSGVILSEDGYIITNYHVIEGESSLKVSLNGEQYDAEVVGSDPTSDLAVIKVNGAEGLVPIEIGSSSDLVVGEWVMTVGSPYGMEQSVGSGIVSAVSRSSVSLQDTEGGAIYANLIQTDAPINPGNSGGALVNKNGELVGINTLAASYSGSNAGVGFAIPADYAIPIAKQIINGEEPSHAQLGVSLVTIDAATAERYNLPVNEGAYVAAVSGGAAEAGIQEGDIITKIANKKVTSATDVILQVRSHSPGDTVTVEVNRNGETKSMDVKLGSDTENKAASSSHGPGNGQ